MERVKSLGFNPSSTVCLKQNQILQGGNEFVKGAVCNTALGEEKKNPVLASRWID
jgi:hypothetical protein